MLLKVLQLLFWLLVLRLVVRTVARAFSPSPDRPRATAGSRTQVRAPEDLVLDRVCHTHVPRSGAVVARVAGREEHFCSAACRDKYRA